MYGCVHVWRLEHILPAWARVSAVCGCCTFAVQHNQCMCTYSDALWLLAHELPGIFPSLCPSSSQESGYRCVLQHPSSCDFCRFELMPWPFCMTSVLPLSCLLITNSYTFFFLALAGAYCTLVNSMVTRGMVSLIFSPTPKGTCKCFTISVTPVATFFVNSHYRVGEPPTISFSKCQIQYKLHNAHILYYISIKFKKSYPIISRKLSSLSLQSITVYSFCLLLCCT